MIDYRPRVKSEPKKNSLLVVLLEYTLLAFTGLFFGLVIGYGLLYT